MIKKSTIERPHHNIFFLSFFLLIFVFEAKLCTHVYTLTSYTYCIASIKNVKLPKTEMWKTARKKPKAKGKKNIKKDDGTTNVLWTERYNHIQPREPVIKCTYFKNPQKRRYSCIITFNAITVIKWCILYLSSIFSSFYIHQQHTHNRTDNFICWFSSNLLQWSCPQDNNNNKN